MNQFESADFRQSYIDKIGGEAVTDSIQLCRIDEFMVKLGGSKQSDRYQDFIVSYMQMKPGWSSISTTLPHGISIKEQELYVTQATYLDLIARPIYDSLQMAYDSSVTVCEIHLAIDLGMNIGGMAVDAFIDEMSDGIATEELIEQFCLYGLDIVKIWHEYENCKGKPIRR